MHGMHCDPASCYLCSKNQRQMRVHSLQIAFVDMKKNAQDSRFREAKVHRSDNRNCFHDAAKRSQLLQGGQSFHIFAIDIYCNRSCCIKFAINASTSIEE